MLKQIKILIIFAIGCIITNLVNISEPLGLMFELVGLNAGVISINISSTVLNFNLHIGINFTLSGKQKSDI